MNKDLVAIFEYLEREKGIKREIVIQAIEESLQAAARKNISGAYNVTVSIHPKTGDIDLYSEKEIVTQVEVPSQEISLEEAQKLDPECEVGQYIDVKVVAKDFGRIAAQKARQIITRKLKNAERDVIYEEYRHRIGELISGTVKRFVRGSNLIIDLGKVEAIMPMREYPRTEKYHVGDKVLALILGVNDTENGGAEVILSRSSPDFVKQLMAQEVPEIRDGIVVIEKIVREPGYRTKMTVRSDPKVDPIGACVGMRGNRVKNVVRELHNEKIDIIPYSDDPIELLQNALSPLEIRKINVNEEDHEISIVVEDDAFAAVIGKKGLNAQLNSQLVEYSLDVQKMTDYNQAIAIQRAQLADLPDVELDERLQLKDLEGVKGVNRFVFEDLMEIFHTPRDLLKATADDLIRVPGVNAATAEKILDQIRIQWQKKISKNKSGK